MISFDERAKDWDSDPAKVERARIVAEAIRTAVPLSRSMSALEYGCGTGLLSFALQSEFESILMADTSQGMLDVLSAKIHAAGIGRMIPVRYDLMTDPLPCSRFDILYALMTLHHIPDTDLALRTFAALIKPNGYLCIADLDQEDGSFHGMNVTDVHKGFAREDLQKQAEISGFHVIHLDTVFTVQKANRSYPLFLMTAVRA